MIENSETPYTLASRKRRIVAFLIDHSVITFLIIAIVFLALGPNFMDADMDKMTTTMFAVMLPGFLLYFAKDSVNGISLGRWMLGIMVRDANNPNEAPPLGRLFIRNLWLIIWPVEFIVLALSEDKKRIGDKTANSIVVKNPNKPRKLPLILALAGIGIIYFAFLFLSIISIMKNSAAYKVAISEIEKNEAIISETGGIKGYGMMPSGSVNVTNGNGQAQLEITVLGNEKDVTVSVYLTKEPNEEWELVEMNDH